ncbi:DNA-binding HxlR family transcriptional regulator [Flavobacterium nitrogenifigens]|uniref:DNA-binding HxlR family transcriptional regulator n=2 Tax=Flavobacterium TaxID=237 RepID=A0A7W7N6Y5_9FLAO|nr:MULTISPECIES: helix-turn-helix domain-containing protein [Flavobacterium]MBB4802158.1 DNA-binding HxlR family transcriptional regulator [Flavobacterium nitrogenifigens]MBB6387116.1 DNA-binding HxlR family transcriptional regulator [Flavobacterium notoginsengisoli]
MKTSKKRSDCPINRSLEIWGDKWSLLIIRDLMFKKQCTYGDFLKSEEKIATNILASRLLVLEENDLITKLDHPDSKAKVLYQLTEKGIELFPVIVEISLWAEKYYEVPEERKLVLEKAKQNKAAFIEKGIRKMKEGL